MKPPDTPRLAWALTGSGHYLRECLALLGPRRTWTCSSAGRPRRCWPCTDIDLKRPARALSLLPRQRRQRPAGRRFYQGCYCAVWWSPPPPPTPSPRWSAGSPIRLVTNIYAQAGKCRVPSIVFACDTAPAMETAGPGRPGHGLPAPDRPGECRAAARLRVHRGSWTASTNSCPPWRKCRDERGPPVPRQPDSGPAQSTQKVKTRDPRSHHHDHRPGSETGHRPMGIGRREELVVISPFRPSKTPGEPDPDQVRGHQLHR